MQEVGEWIKKLLPEQENWDSFHFRGLAFDGKSETWTKREKEEEDWGKRGMNVAEQKQSLVTSALSMEL